LWFSRGPATSLIDTWTIDEHTISDHAMIGFRVSHPSIARPSKQVMIRAWKRADWPLFNNTIRSRKLDFSGLLNKQDTIVAIELLTSTIDGTLNIAVPTALVKTKYAAWWSRIWDGYPQK
jgi:hypothetical protein